MSSEHADMHKAHFVIKGFHQAHSTLNMTQNMGSRTLTHMHDPRKVAKEGFLIVVGWGYILLIWANPTSS